MASKSKAGFSIKVWASCLLGSTSALSSEKPVVTVQLRPEQGLLKEMLIREISGARKQGRISYALLVSPDCEPCKVVEASLRELDYSGRKIQLIELDVPSWRNHLRPLGFERTELPRLYVIDSGGYPQQPGISGEAWSQFSSEKIAFLLGEFFRDGGEKK